MKTAGNTVTETDPDSRVRRVDGRASAFLQQFTTAQTRKLSFTVLNNSTAQRDVTAAEK